MSLRLERDSTALDMRGVNPTSFSLPSNKGVDPSEQATSRAPEDIEAEEKLRELDRIHAAFILAERNLPDPYLEEHPEILE